MDWTEQQAVRLAAQLDLPLDPEKVEWALGHYFQGLLTHTPNALESIRKTLSERYYQHPLFLEYLTRNQYNAIHKALAPESFDRLFEEYLSWIDREDTLEGDEKPLFKVIHDLALMLPFLSDTQKKHLSDVWMDILISPCISVIFFPVLLPSLNPEKQKIVGQIKGKQWKETVLRGLTLRDPGLLLDAVTQWKYPAYRNVIAPYVESDPELREPIAIFTKLSPDAYLTTGLTALLELSHAERLDIDDDFTGLTYLEKIEKISDIAHRLNDIQVSDKGKPYLGKVDQPSLFYAELFKKALPASDHEEWKHYCGDNSDPWTERWQRLAYNGSQIVYGLWFHLCMLASLELVKKGVSFRELLQRQGDWRKRIALMLGNVQLARGGRISFSTRLQVPAFDEIWPGSPLNFGLTPIPDKVLHTTLTLRQRKRYAERVKHFLIAFTKEHPIPEYLTYFRGREVLCFYNAQGEKSFAIRYPIALGDRQVVGTHILWNWPKKTTYYRQGSKPFYIEDDAKGIWVHASGDDKRLMDAEIERLFNSLLKTYDLHTFVRFMYLYWQSLPYQRGGAAVGIILFNLILTLHNQKVPEIPGDLFFWDCEAMTLMEEEFTQKLIEALHQ